MATKSKTPTDEKFEKQDFDLFDALTALDKKDYGYYDRLSEEQQKKFVPYMMTHWMSAIKGSTDLQQYYVMSVDAAMNKHLFNEYVQKNPKLQWLMLCACSPGAGKQFHQWIPHLSNKITQLKETAKIKDISDYYSKIYPKLSSDDNRELSEAFVEEHKKKTYLAKVYPNLKITDIELLAQFVTEQDIKNYERDQGN
jgi:hypothetical protein